MLQIKMKVNRNIPNHQNEYTKLITNVKMNQERGFSNTGQINEMLIKSLLLLTFIYVKVTGRGQVTDIGIGV